MDPLQVITTLGIILGGPILALFGYQQMKLSKMEDIMATLIPANRVLELLKDNVEQTKDRIEDKYEPIRERLDRLEDKIDALIARKDCV